jgi:hypothetical protein
VNVDTAGALSAWNAIFADIKFSRKWHDPTFRFSFPALPNNWPQIIEPVISTFYDWLVKLSFPQNAFPISMLKFNRLSILRAFRDEYSRVCGYCDGTAGDMSDDKAADHVEHFFPRSEYPHLAIHPDNLNVACGGCNSTWKAAQLPVVGNFPGMLQDTYHPRIKPGCDHIQVSVKTDSLNWKKLQLSLSDATRPSRVTNINRMLDLDGRWTGRVNDDLKRERSAYVAWRIDSVLPQDEISVAQCLQAERAYRAGRIDKDADCLLRIEVLNYQTTTPNEIEAILDCHR